MARKFLHDQHSSGLGSALSGFGGCLKLLPASSDASSSLPGGPSPPASLVLAKHLSAAVS